MFGLNLHRDLDPDRRGLEADDLHVVGHVLPVRMVIALALFKRIFTRSLPMNQAHAPIIEVYGTCCASHQHDVLGRRRAERPCERYAQTQVSAIAKQGAEIRSDRQNFLPLWGWSLASGYNS